MFFSYNLLFNIFDEHCCFDSVYHCWLYDHLVNTWPTNQNVCFSVIWRLHDMNAVTMIWDHTITIRMIPAVHFQRCLIRILSKQFLRALHSSQLSLNFDQYVCFYFNVGLAYFVEYYR